MDSNLPKQARCFACIVYPDEISFDLEERIDSLHIPALISPLHVDGEKDGKKHHYHILMKFEGKKSQKQIQTLIEQFGGVGCEIVQDFTAYARYLCHLDSSEKIRYNVDEVKSFGGLSYRTVAIDTDKTTANKMGLNEVLKIIDENDISDYLELVRFCLKNDSPCLNFVIEKAYAVTQMLKAKHYQKTKFKRFQRI